MVQAAAGLPECLADQLKAEPGLVVGCRRGRPAAAGTGAVPATTIRSPTATARENPKTASYGECPLI
jgi:hypothetical protein